MTICLGALLWCREQMFPFPSHFAKFKFCPFENDLSKCSRGRILISLKSPTQLKCRPVIRRKKGTSTVQWEMSEIFITRIQRHLFLPKNYYHWIIKLYFADCWIIFLNGIEPFRNLIKIKQKIILIRKCPPLLCSAELHCDSLIMDDLFHFMQRD